MSEGANLRALARKREEQGRKEDADFLFLMATYFDLLDRVADKVLAHRAPARTAKAKKRQRARRKAQRESSI